MYGDAIWECSNKTGSDSAWYLDNMDEDNSEYEPFFFRGGRWNFNIHGGIFALADMDSDDSYSWTSRIVFTIE